jgi:hypothetical protein
VRGRFTAVVHGEFETTGPRPALIAVLLAAAALVSWLATVLVELAVTAGAFAGAVLAGCWLLTRRNGRDTELLAERAAELHAEVTGTPARAVPQEVHYHLHLPPGTPAADVIAALPPAHGELPQTRGNDHRQEGS